MDEYNYDYDYDYDYDFDAAQFAKNAGHHFDGDLLTKIRSLSVPIIMIIMIIVTSCAHHTALKIKAKGDDNAPTGCKLSCSTVTKLQSGTAGMVAVSVFVLVGYLAAHVGKNGLGGRRFRTNKDGSVGYIEGKFQKTMMWIEIIGSLALLIMSSILASYWNDYGDDMEKCTTKEIADEVKSMRTFAIMLSVLSAILLVFTFLGHKAALGKAVVDTAAAGYNKVQAAREARAERRAEQAESLVAVV